MRARIQVAGIVQGVGFRPFVYTLAQKHRLKGFCLNDSEGVLVEVESDGACGEIEAFIDELRSSAPPLSQIDTLTAEFLPRTGQYDTFAIRESVPREGKFSLVSPDIALCPDCLRELFDPSDRRCRYPFINCTNCGPRYSIVLDIPYDRPKTTMAPFSLCPECEREYRDPVHRRFHAQPNACPACGPEVELVRGTAPPTEGGKGDPVQETIELLRQGAIVAVKGLGGFHLCCDATNGGAVARLRTLKRKSGKPFAIMVPDMDTVRSLCSVGKEEERLLGSRVRPIVLLKKIDPCPLADAVAPGALTLGVMLPYTPLHYLLFGGEGERFTALVMTSGNLSEEPIVTGNDEALEKLTPLADAFLLHDRDIHMRVDDSIVRARDDGASIVVRRARGFVPDALDLGEDFGEVLACGADLKNTFCLTKGRKAIPSQHIGDLENYETLGFFRETLKNLTNTFRVAPEIVAHDMHPGYFSTKLALAYAREHSLSGERCIPVQHHHAHIVSVMAEHGLRGKVIGVAFDGTGYGTDGTLWGGEFLLADRCGFERRAHFQPVPLPGGDAAVREPWRMAVAYLYRTFGEAMFDAFPEFFGRFRRERVGSILGMIRGGINSPLTSSAGRLFDAVSSLIGFRDAITFEGEAAIDLEMAACSYGGEVMEPYSYQRKESSIEMGALIREIVGDLGRGTGRAAIALRFHSTLCDIIVTVAKEMMRESGIRDVVLSGGVFQNRLLAESTAAALRNGGFSPWMNEKVPANDGGISLGQAVAAWERMKKGVRCYVHCNTR
ncbi:MAG: carbamoyltransferase HypF [Alphaproteobacteria bacterium]|uniref:Carbamoyltransferase n=1 Tax=Candidatus Nitrobium versatile TaxID=2884831 RepID=A0A953J9U4_9BACT|nr:carbamoyltransferase HypF [Candidatus Nitrobium versatile]